MNDTLRKGTRCLLIVAALLLLTGLVFAAGFGSAYLLTGNRALPLFPDLSLEPASPAEPPAADAPESTAYPTPIEIPIPANGDEEAFQLFWEVWSIVQRDFYGELPEMDTITYAAIRGMLSTLQDDYTVFIEPKAAAIRAEDASGEYEGIGAYVNVDEDGKLIILEPFKGGPAEAAGLVADDRVIEVDGVSIVGYTLYEAIDLVRGPAGSEVTLLIEREGMSEPFAVTVTRDHFEIEITKVEMLEGDIGYIQLREFSDPAAARVQQGLEDLTAQGARGVILDLRYNPGGWLTQAVEVADLFLDDGVIVTQRWKDGREQAYEARPGHVGEEIPLVVLVDRGSASASEIVAGALQDRERATLIGETTFGKGAVQLVFELDDGSQLLVTSALWFTPNDQPIHGNGLTPDISVPWPDDLEPDQDPQLDRAVQYLLTGE